MPGTGRGYVVPPQNGGGLMSLPISTLDAAALRDLASRLGLPPWRGTQLHQAVWHPGVASLDEVRQLPPAARAALAAQLCFSTAEVTAEAAADAGATLKLPLRLARGLTVP